MKMSNTQIAAYWHNIKREARLARPTSASVERRPGLRICSDVGFKPVSSRYLHGHLEVTMVICNDTAIGAERPFVCLPSIGLPFVEGANWTCDRLKLQTGQEMVRLQWKLTGALAPNDKSLACILRFDVPRGAGPIVKIARGVHRRIDDASNLGFSAIVGAANFPSKRSPHFVNMEALRNQLRRQFPRMTGVHLPAAVVGMPLGMPV